MPGTLVGVVLRSYKKLVCVSLCWVLLCLSWSAASENLGEFSFSDLTLRPRAYVGEISQGGVDVEESLVGFEWNYEDQFYGKIKLGSSDNIVRPFYYDPKTKPEYSVVEAYAELPSAYGTFRLGMLPIHFGLEGGDLESELFLPRSLIYQRGLVGLRDFGAQFYIEHKGFFNELTAHNGEGGPQEDGRTWLDRKSVV